MKQKRIKDIIEKKVLHLESLCEDISKSFDREVIHEFRTSMKSLRAFLRLQKMHTGNKKIAITKKCKELYQIAGVIREAQLEMELLRKNEEAIPSYMAWLMQTIEQKKKAWAKYSTKKVFGKLNRKLADIKYPDMQPQTLEQFFNQRIEAANALTGRKQPTDNQLHNARKKIKDILYLTKLSQREWKAANSFMKEPPVKSLNSLAKKIGDYNDERMKLEHLNNFIVNPDETEEKLNMQVLKTEEMAKLATMRKGVLKAVHTFTKKPA